MIAVVKSTPDNVVVADKIPDDIPVWIFNKTNTQLIGMVVRCWGEQKKWGGFAGASYLMVRETKEQVINALIDEGYVLFAGEK